MEGPWVLPGHYTVRLQLGMQRFEQRVEVLEDPRIQVTEQARADWHRKVMSLAGTLRSFLVTADTVAEIKQHLDSLDDGQQSRNRDLKSEVDEIAPLVAELRSRLTSLYGEVSEWPTPFTADQQSQQEYFEGWIRRLEPRVRRVMETELR